MPLLKSFRHFLSKENSIGWIIALGAVLRLLFLFTGGPIYFGHADYFIQGDTSSWFKAFIHLYDYGTFTVSSAVEAGKFFRPPGYSFLFGICYLLALKNYVLAWKILVGVQVLMDITSIYIFSRIAKGVAKNTDAESKILLSNTCGLLYAIYPFAIIWTPVLYAETSSVFFLLLSIHFAFQKNSYRAAFLSGLAGGIATLIRLQCAFGILFVAGTFLFSGDNKFKNKIKHAFVFCIAILFTYGLWPARNYFLQNRVLFSQDLKMGYHWSPDFMSFLDFTHSISTDHTSYYFQILKDEKVEWPAEAYIDPGDSALLDSAVTLCRTCGTGFAYWKWGERISPTLEAPENPCDSTIQIIFRSLLQKQKTIHAFHYWITIPLENLQKCLLKISLYGNKSSAVKLFSNLLFIFRSILIIIGVFGIYIAYKSNTIERKFLVFVMSYMSSWYLYISFFYRNIEMRYLLHTDILLLIPAAIVIINLFFKKYQKES